MNNQFNFKLIDGLFAHDDAAEILRTLLRTKINHHRTHKLSLEERFGNDHLNYASRIKELQSSLENLEAFLSQPELKGKKLTLSSDVAIRVKATKPELVS